MNNSETALNLHPKIKNALFVIIYIMLFISGIFLIVSLKHSFEYDTDEGINLMKSWLFIKGFPLYAPIWSDQPPLFTVILSFWLKLFGLSVYHARILMLIFSSMLLWAFYQTIKMVSGRISAFVAIVLLLTSAIYLRLSVSVMIGLPSLAFAMFSIYFITLYKKLGLTRYLIISAIFMALSLQTKLLTIFFLPLFIIEIISAGWGNRKKNEILFHVFLWAVTFFTGYFSIMTIFFHFNFNMLIQQLFLPHLNASAFNKPNHGFFVIRNMLYQDYDIVLLALLGAALLIKRREWKLLFPLLWLVSAFLILINHKPIWYHHYLLICIPCCWLAAFSFNKFFRKGRAEFYLTACLIIFIVLMIPAKVNRISKSLTVGTTIEERAMVGLISKYRKDISWIMSDRPIFAFYANIPIPPELIVISEKRILTKNLTKEYLISTLNKYKPEQILLARFENEDIGLLSYIQENYYKVNNGKIKLYVLKNVLKQ